MIRNKMFLLLKLAKGNIKIKIIYKTQNKIFRIKEKINQIIKKKILDFKQIKKIKK